MTPRYETKKTREAEEQARIAVQQSLPDGWELRKADDAEHYDWVFLIHEYACGIGEYKGRPAYRHDEFMGIVFSAHKADKLRRACHRYGVWCWVFFGFSDGLYRIDLTRILYCQQRRFSRREVRRDAPRDNEECFFIPSHLLMKIEQK